MATHKPIPKPKFSIEEMAIIASCLEKQTGHYVSYGDVQKAIATGKIDPVEILVETKL